MVTIVRRAFRLFSGKGARFLGAAVAFYALLSAAPLFVLVIRLVGAVFGRGRAEDALYGGLSRWVAPEGLHAARELTERFDHHGSNWLSYVAVVYGSTRLFRALRRALNQLWDIDLERVEEARPTAVKYGIRYGEALGLALFVALLVAIIVTEKTLVSLVPTGLVWPVDLATSGVLAFFLFAVLFRVLPETDVTMKEAFVSSAVTTALFALGSSLVTLYVRHKPLGDLYAGASAVVIAVLWVYYSAQVFFFGACVGAALRDRQ